MCVIISSSLLQCIKLFIVFLYLLFKRQKKFESSLVFLALSVKVVVQEHLYLLSTFKVIYSFTFPLMYPLKFLSRTRCLNILDSHV